MCGVAAVLGNNIPIEPVAAAIQHRGIRSTIVQTKAGAIAHARLPIVGLSEDNDQPVRRGQHLIAFVGEVLDFNRDLGDCDLATVVDAWDRLGPKGLRGHDGFWSIVVLDDALKQLHVVCDYLGQKPMFWRSDAPSVASEPDALLRIGPPATIDEIYMAAVIKWGYCPDGRRTPWKEIKRVLPGEHLMLRADGRCTVRLVDPLVPATRGRPDVLKLEIVAAVERRVLSSDVPVGCLFSGGLDSSIVYALASRYGIVLPYYVRSADPAQQDPEELQRAQSMAVNLQICEWSGVTLRECVEVMQEPIDLGSLAPQIALSRAVKKTVCLTGDGADEMFGGYGRSARFDSQASDVWHELVLWHLQRLDRVMMRQRIEVRSPFLARRVAEMALGLPRELRTGKKILRDLFRDDLPPGIADQPKVPLRTPEVENGREGRSHAMAEVFRGLHRA